MTDTVYNEHIRLAQAMLHGHLYIDPAPPWMEHISTGGHDYILHGPLSALLCLPFVAVGITNQRLICIILGLVAVALCYKLTQSLWLTAFFLGGTTFLYEMTNGASWDFALVATTPFTLAALIQLRRLNDGDSDNVAVTSADTAKGLVHVRQLHNKERLSSGDERPASVEHTTTHPARIRPERIRLKGMRSSQSCRAALVGLFAGLAALARYDLVLAWPVYLWMIWRKGNDSATELLSARPANEHAGSNHRLGINFRGVCLCSVGLLASALVMIWFNEARFGTLTDGSVSEWYWHYDTFRIQRPFGPFSVHYIPFNLYTLGFMAPAFREAFPWLRPSFMGQSLLSLSPAFLMVRKWPWIIAAFLCSIPALTVYASGFSQLGCRYYVQTVPFLVAAMIPDAKSAGLSTSVKALICASVFLSMSATMTVWAYGLVS